MARNVGQELARQFAYDVAEYCKLLHKKKEYNIEDQIKRSSSSIYANLNESVFAVSDAEKFSKLSISLKEANETMGWLKHAQDIGLMEDEYLHLFKDCRNIIRLLYKSVKTLQEKIKNS